MHTTVYEKIPKFLACWHAWRLANVIDVAFLTLLMQRLGQQCPTRGPHSAKSKVWCGPSGFRCSKIIRHTDNMSLFP